MSDRLYDMMDWAAIEAMVYSEEDHPHDILGAKVMEEGVLLQAFFPGAVSVCAILDQNRIVPMELEDEAGFFAALLPGKSVPAYRLKAAFEDGSSWEGEDPYNFEPQITEEEEARFHAGIAYDIYKKLGAHPMVIHGVSGVYFALWAPNAKRVSVVGDFNNWDGRRLPMRRLPDSGIFELFVPGLKPGCLYKYEIKAKSGLTYLKTDPYGYACERRPDTASIVTDLTGYEWQDEAWLVNREKTNAATSPMFIYEVHLGSFRRQEETDQDGFYNYRELAVLIGDHVKKTGYTHVQLMPVMEHPLDASWGYQTLCYYAPTSRFGTPEDFMYFVDYLHKQRIGVILDWTPAYFPADNSGLIGFDGTNLYEHHDPRQGYSPNWGTLVYNYGRPQVKNFLIANALFWAKVYHADGIHMNAVSSMLYLDYGRSDGQWVANMYGGNENLEAIEFLKHLNSIFKQEIPGAILTADESSAWPRVTGNLDEDGLGFDYKWNNGWSSDVMGYMQLDPVFRSYHHQDLIFSMI
ncbi:MAG: 1,4-alpha-glucan branching enzyme, partial [Lachnospiraceae bacterium]|nr:1,4-alpha-glucan branching enzyme [Lachnospiraceae bacterium]